MIYDAAAKIHPPGYPCRCYDVATGEEVNYVVRYDTETHETVRYQADDAGQIAIVDGKPVPIVEVRELRFVSKGTDS